RASAPGVAVCWTLQPDHTQPMIFGIPAGVSDNDHMITDLQRVAGDALTSELTAASPLHRITDKLTVRLLHFKMNKRMGIPEQKLNQITLDLFLFVFKIRCCKGVVRRQLTAGYRNQHRCGNQENDQSDLHVSS